MKERKKKEYNNSLCHNTNTTQQQETVTWNTRVKRFVKEFFQERGIAGGRLIEEKYFEYKQNELPLLLKERAELLSRVAQIDVSVSQINAECGTNNVICDTIYKQFEKQGRDINNVTKEDRFWIKAQLENNNVQTTDVDGFLAYCRERKNGIE